MPDCSSPYADEGEAQASLMQLGAAVDDALNGDRPYTEVGFALLAAYDTANGESRCSLVTNMSPHDLLATLKVQVARLEGQAFTPGHA
jgi:hypothetical protein